MDKQYIESFETSPEAWKFITDNLSLLKLNGSNFTLGVEKRKGAFWVVLKRK